MRWTLLALVVCLVTPTQAPRPGAAQPVVVGSVLPRVVLHRADRSRQTSVPRRQILPASAGIPSSFHRLWRVTAYCATGNRAANGQWPYVGGAATLDRSIPFGTRLLVPGYGVVTVIDRIGHGSDLDLYFGSGDCEQRANAWGAQTLTVTQP